MYRRWKWAATALFTVFTLTIPALGANIVADGVSLTADQAWIEEGTTYMTLRSYAALTGHALAWADGTARLSGMGLELQASPGELYLESNGRALYVPETVSVSQGKLVLPLRVLCQATGAELTWDAQSATVTLNTLGAKPSSANYNEEDLYWLSRIISAESRGEPLIGQIAVGNVVLNRIKSAEFPNSVKDVVFDSQYAIQFEPVANGTVYDPPTLSALVAAKLCLEGANVVGDCLYFFAPSLSPGTWIVNNRTYFTTIGTHQFYL